MNYNFSHKNIIQSDDEKLLTIVLPIRVSEDRKDIIDRLAYLEHNGPLPKEMQVLVIDDGSQMSISKEIMDFCETKQYSYLRLDTHLFPISMARARNAAAVSIETRYVLFQDVDLLPYEGFYQDMMKEIHISKMNEVDDEFIMFGVIYLTKDSTQEFFDTDPALRKHKFIQYFLENRKDKVEKFSTGTSVVVFNRYHYLMHGGQSQDFEKWGYEDLEFMCRIGRSRMKFPRPNDYQLDYKGFSNVYEYKGWKSMYRLFGDMTFAKGMIMFHSWHPVNHDGDYKLGSQKNRLLFEQKMRDYVGLEIEPAPLPMYENGSTLILKSNPWTLNRQVLPLWGNISYEDGDSLALEDFKSLILNNRFSRVVFFNPYANENILTIYQYCRKYNIPYIIVERGALRDSVFFDPNGFNADSISYDAKYWDKPLTQERYSNLIKYISDERVMDDSLEQQSKRLGADKTKHNLRIPQNKKVLFVPLQRPSDTVIKYYSGRIVNFDNFTKLVADVTDKISSEWVVVVKRHPLEVETPEIPGTINADNVNVKDLLDIADKTLLINSGVGLLSLLWGVEVLYAGQAFYGHDSVAKNCSTLDEVVSNLNWRHDSEKVSRFLSYLIDEFYSFGKFTTRVVPLANKEGLISATTNIQFYKLRLPFYKQITVPYRTRAEISSDSPLFDRYKGNGSNIKFEDKKGHVQVRQKGTFKAKFRKLKKNPTAFFIDSSNPLLHGLGYLMSKLKN